MTSTLVILGASLMDAGNIASLLAITGEEPFADPMYAKGDHVRASDGPVLGERLVALMGGDPSDSQLFNVLSTDAARQADVHNYAHGGARSDTEPSQSFLGFNIGIGLKSQVKAMKSRADFYRAGSDVDVLLSAGGNDLLTALENLEPFERALSTRRRRDDKRLMRSISRPISRNIQRAVDQITGLVDEVVVLGAMPISATTRAQKLASKVKNASAEGVLDLLDAVSSQLQRRLSQAFADDLSVVVLDGQALWRSVDDPVLLDGLHPTSQTSGAIAELAVPIAMEQLNSFGFA